jgi:hypothetical protein
LIYDEYATHLLFFLETGYRMGLGTLQR